MQQASWASPRSNLTLHHPWMLEKPGAGRMLGGCCAGACNQHLLGARDGTGEDTISGTLWGHLRWRDTLNVLKYEIHLVAVEPDVALCIPLALTHCTDLQKPGAVQRPFLNRYAAWQCCPNKGTCLPGIDPDIFIPIIIILTTYICINIFTKMNLCPAYMSEFLCYRLYCI